MSETIPQATVAYADDRRQALEALHRLPWQAARVVIAEFYGKYDIPVPADDDALRYAIHAMQLKHPSTEDAYHASYEWLWEQVQVAD